MTVEADDGFLLWSAKWFKRHPYHLVLDVILIVISGGAVIPLLVVVMLYLWATDKEFLF